MSLSTGKIVALGAAAIVVVVGISLFSSYIKNYNSAVSSEQLIKNFYDSMESQLGQYENQIIEQTQVTDMQREDLRELFVESLSARYGENGSRSMFQMLTEQNPTLDQSTYQTIVQTIEAGRNDFADANKKLADQKRVYCVKLKSFWSGFMMRLAGFPNLNVGCLPHEQDDFPTISTERASTTFSTGIEQSPIQLRR